jgi:1,4-dihydroxy-2-naphthoyl-CoA synthase
MSVASAIERPFDYNLTTEHLNDFLEKAFKVQNSSFPIKPVVLENNNGDCHYCEGGYRLVLDCYRNYHGYLSLAVSQFSLYIKIALVR